MVTGNARTPSWLRSAQGMPPTNYDSVTNTRRHFSYGYTATPLREVGRVTWPADVRLGTLRFVNMNTVERRQRRSADPLVALHYQLSSARHRDDLDAIVVADLSGVVVAGAGSWAACEELAAYAPMLADASDDDIPKESAPSRLDALRGEVSVRSVDVGGQQVLLCSWARAQAAKAPSELELSETARGVSRILTQAAA